MIGNRPAENLLAKARLVVWRPFSTSALYSTSRTAPEWLQSVLATRRIAPKLYAWDLSNIDDPTPSSKQVEKSLPIFKPSRPQNDPQKRIYIVGVGNLGVLFASSIASLENPPPITLVVHRKDLLLSWKQEPGIQIRRGLDVQRYSDFDVELWSEEAPCHGQTREVADGQSIRNLIVTTKASQALPEVDRVRRYLNGESTVAFAQNGVCKMWPPHGTAYTMARYLQAHTPCHPNWLACVTTHGVTSLSRFNSVHKSKAHVKIGPVLLSPEAPKTASYLSEILTQAPHLRGEVIARDELWSQQLEKLVLNSIINPLTAILRCKNGWLFTGEAGHVAQLMDTLLVEASRVLQALVQDSIVDSILEASPNGTANPVVTPIDRDSLLKRFSEVRLRSMLYKVGHAVRDNTSSMLQDVLAGKRTEIDELNGWLVETAAYLGGNLDVTSHKTLIDLVKSDAVLDVDSLSNYFPSLAASRPAGA